MFLPSRLSRFLAASVFTAILLMFVQGCENEPSQSVDVTQMVPDNPELVRPVLPGMKAPAFSLTAADGSNYTFNPDELEKPVVLIFYRGGWCPYCNRHLAELRTVESELRDMGFDILFLSADRYEVIRESLKMKDIEYTLIADNKLEAARAYGVAFRLDDQTAERYISMGLDIEAASGETHHWLPIPATFVIGRDGMIQFQYANPNYKVRIHPDLLLTAASLAVAGDA